VVLVLRGNWATGMPATQEATCARVVVEQGAA
jgi:hypothetical protein